MPYRVFPVVISMLFAAGCTTPEDTGTPVPFETERRLLHEVFTGSTCGPCEPAEGYIDETMAARPGLFTSIKYQLGGDPYFTHEGLARRLGYNPPGVTGYSLPWLQLDGLNAHHPNDMDGDEVYDFSDVYGVEWFDRYQSIPAGMELSVTHSIEGQTVSFTVSIYPLAEYQDLVPQPELVLHAAIVEGVTYNNIGSNGQTEFHHVMKKMVPDEDGTPISGLVRKEEQTLSLSYTFNGDYNPDTTMAEAVDHDIEHTVEEFEDLHVVVFVQEATTLEVFQSAWTIQ